MPQVNPELVEEIVRDAGGKITGQTRLQKTAYLLAVAGLHDSPRFTYRHDGPYSEDIAKSAKMGSLLGNLKEEEENAEWGGVYSIYSIGGRQGETSFHSGDSVSPERSEFARTAAGASSVVLELVASAVFLFLEGFKDPWKETERRKPEKVSDGRLDEAKRLLAELRAISVPNTLPEIH